MGERIDTWIAGLGRRDRLVLNYGLWVIAVLLVVLGMALLAKPHHTYEGNGLPAGTPIQQGRTITGVTPVDAFHEDVQLDTSQVSGR
jgi:hypothetical protein